MMRVSRVEAGVARAGQGPRGGFASSSALANRAGQGHPRRRRRSECGGARGGVHRESRRSGEAGSLTSTRRDFGAFVLVVSGLVLDLGAGEARGEADAKPKRPKGYDRLARDITKAIRKTVELEASGASLSEIRKSGDPVKGYYRELLTKYDSDRRVNADPSFVSLTDVFRELGSFYRANGPNSRLTEPVRDSVLTKLQAIDEALE